LKLAFLPILHTSVAGIEVGLLYHRRPK